MNNTHYTRHIVVATGLYPPQIGGPATYSKLLVDELPKRGWEVTVVNFGDVMHLPRVVRHMVYAYRLFRATRRTSIIYAQDPVSVGIPAWCVSMLARVPFGIRIAGDYAWEQARQRFGVTDSIDVFQSKRYSGATWVLKQTQSFIARRATFIVTPSVYFKNVVSTWGVRDENMHAIYNGIRMNISYPDKRAARVACNISPDARVVVSAGRLVPWKGFRGVIDAVIELNATSSASSPYHVYIIGDGPDRGRLEEYVVSHNSTDTVHLVGSVDADTMRTYMSAADVFVLNTSFESFSFQVVEAMAAGTPVVTTRIGSLPELIDDGREGILIEPDDREALRAAITHLTEQTPFAAHIADMARMKSQQFSINHTVERLVAVLLRI